MDYSFLSFCVGGVLLLVAAFMDAREREISDAVWIAMLLAALVFLAVDFNPLIFTSLTVASVLALALYKLNFGGADIKAIFAIALLFPRYPKFACFPLAGIPPLEIFVLSVVTNALILGISAPLTLFVANALRGNFSPLMFLGIKVPADSLRNRKFFRLMHAPPAPDAPTAPNAQRAKCKYVWGGLEPSEEYLRQIEDAARRGIVKEVWITPELPFVVFLTAGFFTASLLGDFIFMLLSALQ
ncbi:MAG: prepilin peptidase [Candidatus Methanospirare jalkutatii]|nr:prepilin peptidase [Candidatus Methanospirare jalkutatii]